MYQRHWHCDLPPRSSSSRLHLPMVEGMSLATLGLRCPEATLSLACLIFFFLFRRHVKRSSSVPWSWPLLGMLPGLFSQFYRFYDWITDVLTDSCGTFLFNGPWFSGMEILATADPANVRYVFCENFANYPKGEQFLEIFDILGDGIFNADSESWKSQRKMIHSLMVEPRFREFVARTSRDMVQNGLLPLLSRAAEQRTIIDLQDFFFRFTFDSTCKLVCGVDTGCLSLELPSVAFAKAIDDAEEVIFFRHTVPEFYWKLLKLLKVGKEKTMALAWKTTDDFISRLVLERKEDLEKISQGKCSGIETAPDLLTSILCLQQDQSVFSHKFLRDVAYNLIVAGRDTTGTALAWFFWLISQHPEVERKILDELKSVKSCLPESPRVDSRVFFVEDLSSAIYLQAALHESLRLFPSVPINHKTALKPDVLPSGHRVSPKTKILFFMYAMARMESVWGEDCREFKPERWISDEGKIKREPSYKFFTFNSGPRTCLGKDMALTQLKVVAATLLCNFRFVAARDHNVVPRLSVILHMKEGLKVTVERL